MNSSSIMCLIYIIYGLHDIVSFFNCYYSVRMRKVSHTKCEIPLRIKCR
jgi:hypothetical protein